ncbi:MAG TPA: acyl-ACP desaturase [Tepidisphaeraceae bacterium]|nr:acyl-ACP desaturase [Tepidisphaeraceae bacterium]
MFMESSSETTGTQREVLRGLEAAVGENLNLLLPVAQAWQPTDYLPDLTAEDWREQVQKLREPAGELSDGVLVVLVADMVTEEALPSYSVSLNILAEDYQGTSDRPWAKWLRGWTAEENRHGDLLNAYLRLTGRVDMRQVEVTVHNLLNNGFDARAYPDLYGGLVYTAFQERATKISHANVGKLAGREGDAALTRICQKIAGDEARHEAFYTAMMSAVFDQDPNGGMITAMSMLRRVIAMPGRLMYDGKDPDLFDHFAAVAQRLGVYTVEDYASIVEHLVKTWKLAERSVSGKGARAQDFLCGHAEKCRSKAAEVTEIVAKQPPVAFSWIHGRSV